ncbi:metal ABC transporter substrate-binding protein [bacterium]|nr:metal ABC transporter substrate-binding protein [bacterium]
MIRRITLLLWCALASSAWADLKVATLHPVLTDLAQQVGGKHVEVIGLLKLGGDPHNFSPSSSDIRKMSTARLILASGKGMEPYLPKLPDSLTKEQKILDVGKTIPSLTISEESGLFVCCPHHSEGSLDPHWWHSVKNMQRATKIVSKAFAKADPSNAATYAAQAKAYEKHLETLAKWARKEVAKIPRDRRKLATAHAAYTYFCQDFGFQSMPVQGLTKEREPSSQYLADVITDLKDNSIKAVFPEAQANPKVLKEMVRGTGAKIGGKLFADYTGNAKTTTYEAMFRHNVTTIVKGLTK